MGHIKCLTRNLPSRKCGLPAESSFPLPLQVIPDICNKLGRDIMAAVCTMSAFAAVQARSCSSKTACAPSAPLQLRAGERRPHALLHSGPSTHWP
jgi:hypothetical protein